MNYYSQWKDLDESVDDFELDDLDCEIVDDEEINRETECCASGCMYCLSFDEKDFY